MAIKTVQSEILSELYSQTLLVDPNGIDTPPTGEVYQGVYDGLRWTKDDTGLITWQTVGAMVWKNIWAPGEYNKNDVVRDGDWTMVANKQTTDRPSPQPIGQLYWYYKGLMPDTQISTAQSVFCGARLISPYNGFISKARIYVSNFQSQIYRIILVDNSNPSDPVYTISQELSFIQNGWNILPIDTFLVTKDTPLDLWVQVQSNTGTPTVQSQQYFYIHAAGELAPGTGTIYHATGGIMTINKTSMDGDFSAYLATLNPGDDIEVGDTKWEILSITDNGSYYTYLVAPDVLDLINGIQTTVTFTQFPDTSIEIQTDIDHWLTDPSVQGLYQENGFDNPTINDNAYPIDLEVQEAVISDDYDLLAYGGSSSASSGGWIPYYEFDKVDAVTVTAVHPTYQRINTLDYIIPAHPVVYEYKISLTYNLDTALRSAYFRFSIDGGTTWTVIITEPSDSTNDVPVTYFFPKQYGELAVVASKFLLEAAGEGGDDFIIHFSDLMVEKVKDV